MFALTILIIIQFIFCLIFFLYFRQKITVHLKLKEFRKEIDEVIVLFNRQAERHISYLESLLENEIFKKQDSRNQISSTEKNFKKNTDTHDVPNFSNPDPNPETASYKKTFSAPFIDSKTSPPSRKSLSSESQPTLPPQAVHAFYAQFSTPTTKIPETDPAPENPPPPAKKTSLKEAMTEKILLLSRNGLTVSQIAKHLSISTAEVKIILKLNQRI